MSVGRILVLQMCRMGDLLQSGPMLRGLRREHPEASITLVVMDAFAGTPLPSRLYDRLVAFPHASLSAGLAGPNADWHAQLDRLHEFLREVGDAPFDLAINLTQSDLSSLVMALIPARHRVGPLIKPDRQRAVLGGPMQYFWGNARARVFGCFNLVDLFSWSAGVACDGDGLEITVSAAAESSIDLWMAQHGLTGRAMIALQLGASEEGKRWPAERFAAMADALSPETGEIVLVGARGERRLGDRFLAAAKRKVHDAIGVTSLEELGALLRRCRLLITNDTGTMHVATAVGTRVMDVSTGPVFVHETGPYGVGHLVIEPKIDCFPCAAGSECHHHACWERLAPGDAAAIARYAVGEAPLPSLPGVRVLTARRSRAGRIEYWPVEPSEVSAQDVVRRAAGRVWEETLGVPELPAPAEAERGGPDLLPGGEGGDDALSRACEHLPQGWSAAVIATLDDLAHTATRAAALARSIPSSPAARQQQLAGEAHRCLERLVRLGETERACHPIVGFLLVEIDSVLTTDLRSVAAAHGAAYSGAADRARRLAFLLGHLPCSLTIDERVAR